MDEKSFKPFKVAFINPQSYENLGLYDSSLLGAIRAADDRFVIRYYCHQKFSFELPLSIKKIEIFHYSNPIMLIKGVSYCVSMALLLIRIINFQPHILHVQWPKIPVLDTIACRILRRLLPKTTFIHTVHNALPHQLMNGANITWRLYYRSFDHLIVHHRTTQKFISGLFDVPQSNILVNPHGPLRFRVDRELAETSDKRLRQSIEKLDNPEKPVFSFLGYLRYYKGLDIISQLISNLELQGRIRWLIAGQGDISSLQQFKHRTDLHIINRRLTTEEFMSAVRLSDLVILPYREISQSGLLMTVIPEGIPVLVSNRGAMKDTVERYPGSGWVVENPEPREIVDKILEILDDLPSKRLPIPQRSIDEQWSEIGQKTAELYLRLSGSISSGKPSRPSRLVT